MYLTTRVWFTCCRCLVLLQLHHQPHPLQRHVQEVPEVLQAHSLPLSAHAQRRVRGDERVPLHPTIHLGLHVHQQPPGGSHAPPDKRQLLRGGELHGMTVAQDPARRPGDGDGRSSEWDEGRFIAGRTSSCCKEGAPPPWGTELHGMTVAWETTRPPQVSSEERAPGGQSPEQLREIRTSQLILPAKKPKSGFHVSRAS